MFQRFLDVIILKYLKSNDRASGYDIILFLHRKFNILPSSGTVYSTLYSLERQDLVEGQLALGKRIYRLTFQGKEFLNQVCTRKNAIHTILSAAFSEA